MTLMLPPNLTLAGCRLFLGCALMAVWLIYLCVVKRPSSSMLYVQALRSIFKFSFELLQYVATTTNDSKVHHRLPATISHEPVALR